MSEGSQKRRRTRRYQYEKILRTLPGADDSDPDERYSKFFNEKGVGGEGRGGVGTNCIA